MSIGEAQRALQGASSRLAEIDATRGLIIVFMAMDHVSGFILRRHSVEFWAGAWTQYGDPLQFFFRFLSHLCAPGFFFWMGTGIALLAASRERAGWGSARIRRFLLVRGLVLVTLICALEYGALQLGSLGGRSEPLNAPPPGVDGSIPILFVASVIQALGFAMLLSAIIGAFNRSALWAIGGAALAALCNALIPPPAAAAHPAPLWQGVLYLTGQAGWLFSVYPILPWFALCALGIAYGGWLSRDRENAQRSYLRVGLGAIALALVLRATGTFGNIRLPRDSSFIEFLNLIKYPPALVFTLLFTGGNLVLAWIFARLGGPITAVLGVFGRAPLFFFLAHLWLYALVGYAFFRNGTSYPIAIPIWLGSMIPLYYACRWFDEFKQRRPIESWWRVF